MVCLEIAFATGLINTGASIVASFPGPNLSLNYCAGLLNADQCAILMA